MTACGVGKHFFETIPFVEDIEKTFPGGTFAAELRRSKLVPEVIEEVTHFSI
jgi:hypothetical protein